MIQFRSLAILIVSFFISVSAISQSIIWQNTIGGSQDENLFNMEMSKDGKLLTIGFTMSNNTGDVIQTNGSNDFWFMELDPSNGDIIWQESYGGSFMENGTAFIETTDGGYLLGGYTNSNISGDITENSRGGDDYWVVKLDSNRNIEWQKRYGGDKTDRLSSLIQTADGGYLIGGTSESGISGEKSSPVSGRNDFWIIKIDATGNMEWEKTIGGDDGDSFAKIIKAVDGGYILAGSSASGISGDKTDNSRGFGGDYWLLKIDDSGNIIWQKTIGGDNGDYLNSIHATRDGNYIVVGDNFSEISGEKAEPTVCNSVDIWVLKLDPSGNIIWQKDLGGSSTEYQAEVRELANGGFIVGTMSYSDISGYKSENSRGERDYWLIELDANGNVVNDKTLGGSKFDQFKALVVDSDGKYIVGGWSTSDISGDKSENSHGAWDYWILKMQMVSHEESQEENNYQKLYACAGENLILEGPEGISYYWTGPDNFISDEQNPEVQNISPLNAGVYNLTVEDGNFCSTSYIYELIVTEASNLNLQDRHECFDGLVGYARFDLSSIASSILDNQEGLSVSFYEANGIEISESEYDSYNLPESKTLKVVVTSQGNSGCSSANEINLVVDHCHNELDIFPDYFSPNSDGINDQWAIEENNQSYLKSLYIFDRYGKLLKQLNNSNFWSWDGIYRGILMPADDYWYKALTRDNNIMTGHFSLLR